MLQKYNSMAFTPEEVKKNLHIKLITLLSEFNQETQDSYNDIHICSDGYCTIVEWVTAYYNKSDDGGKFTFVDEDEVIMLDRSLPDDTTILCYSEEEYQEKLSEWLKDHPTWKINQYGRWYDEEAQKKFEQELLKETKKGQGD